MREINFREPDNQTWQKWRRDCEKETKKLISTVNNGGKPKIKERLYKREKEVYFNKDGPFHGKCRQFNNEVQHLGEQKRRCYPKCLWKNNTNILL